MRVVAGQARGRRLVAPDGTEVRPTSDRVREAVFNALHSLGAIEGSTVLDLFAGSGALGIEALSRGAAHVVFVDHHRGALDAIAENLDRTGLGADAQVVRADAMAYLRRMSDRVDLALVDPPYAFAEWDELLASVRADLVVAESDREIPAPDGWHVVRTRRYGGTVVTLLRPPVSTPCSAPTPEPL